MKDKIWIFKQTNKNRFLQTYRNSKPFCYLKIWTSKKHYNYHKLTQWRAISLRNYISDNPFANNEGWETWWFCPLWDNVLAPAEAGCEQLSEHPGQLPWPSWAVGGQLVSHKHLLGHSLDVHVWKPLPRRLILSHDHLLTEDEKSLFLPTPMVNVKGYSETEFLRLKYIDEGLFMLSKVFLTCSNQDTNKMTLNFLFICHNRVSVCLFM